MNRFSAESVPKGTTTIYDLFECSYTHSVLPNLWKKLKSLFNLPFIHTLDVWSGTCSKVSHCFAIFSNDWGHSKLVLRPHVAPESQVGSSAIWLLNLLLSFQESNIEMISLESSAGTDELGPLFYFFCEMMEDTVWLWKPAQSNHGTAMIYCDAEVSMLSTQSRPTPLQAGNTTIFIIILISLY